ncbi:hypothetical protein ACIBKY_26850 [Nonomuraea sp. NPDC050394]|uniref:hypothetical protein n=1 Tax=Nonomuraea sp. NPDC050394 TaxID=3364363 RepID=UPI00379297BD
MTGFQIRAEYCAIWDGRLTSAEVERARLRRPPRGYHLTFWDTGQPDQAGRSWTFTITASTRVKLDACTAYWSRRAETVLREERAA